MPYGNALAGLIRAGVAASRGKLEQAIKSLTSTESALEAVDMALYAAGARRCRGLLIGGEQGKELVKAADSWMSSQGIKNQERMTAMLAPGKWH